MKETLLRQAARLKKKNNQHKHWQKAVSILACIVVFCTVYALILPAVTMEKTAYCGKEEHTHTEECYEKKLICGKEEGDGAHQHTDDCYREEEVLVCTIPESDGHQHTDDCYTEEEVLTCTNTDPDHVHNEFDGCYTTERVLTCGKEVGEGAHHHSEGCYETKKELVCGQEENDGHHHTEECYKKELICKKEEHTHTLACYSDPNADVESEEQWSRTFANVTLTGNWAKDVVAIAETQIGYTESDRNYTVNEDNTTNGYTRYGQWAGMPYADWSATFTSFCLRYANIPESAVPRNTGCEGWNSSMVSPDSYTPKEGDIIILDGNQDGTPEHAGIVTSGSETSVTAIIGDSDKAVKKNTYTADNAIITGYVPMPENPAMAADDKEETTPTPEVTEEPEETPTPEITEEPQETPTPEITEEPEETPTPEITEEPEKTPTPTPVSDDAIEVPEEALSRCVVERIEDVENNESDIVADAEENEIDLFSNAAISAYADGDTIDFGQYITSATVQKIVNGKWEDATEFEDGDPVRVNIKYNLPAGVVTGDDRTITYQLPTGVLPLEDLGGSVYSKGSKVGTYQISKTGLITITFDQSFAEGGSRITGDVEFMGTLSSDNKKEDKEIIFDGKGGTITIKKEEETPETGDIAITKEGALSTDKETIKYTLKVTTKNGTKKQIKVSDQLTNAIYDQNSLVVKDANGNVVNGYDCKFSSSNDSFEINNLPELKIGEFYTIEYDVKANNPQKDGSNTVNNSASANDKSAWKQIEVSKPKINKEGTYNEDTGKITWTIKVYTNEESLDGYRLSDKIDGIDYSADSSEGNVLLYEMDKDGNATGDGTVISLPYTFDESHTNQYGYVIKYMTDAPQASESSKVKNEATIEKGDKNYSSDKTIDVTVRSWDLSKRAQNQSSIDSEKQRLNWQSTITMPNKKIRELGTFIYTDTIEDGTSGDKHYGVRSEIEAAIRSSIKINYIDNQNGQITEEPLDNINWLDYTIQYLDAYGNPVNEDSGEVKSFSITFTPAQNANVEYTGKYINFSYSTVGMKTLVKEGESESFTNKAGMNEMEVTASITYKNPLRLIKESSVNGSVNRPTQGDHTWITNPEWISGFSKKLSSAELGSDNYIYYRIILDPEDKMEAEPGEIILTDELPKGTEYVDSSGYAVYIAENLNGIWTDSSSMQQPSFTFDAVNGKLIIKFERNSYHFTSQNQNDKIAIYYAVKVNDSELEGTGSHIFKNNVKWGENRTASTETDVKKHKDIIYKTGHQHIDEYGNLQKSIDYNIVINPDGEDLDLESDTVTLTDIFTDTAKKLQSINLDLSSVKLYVYDPTQKDSRGAEIDTSRYVVEYKDLGSGKRQLKVTLPDGLACVLGYSYQYDNGGVAGNIDIKNEAKLGSYSSKEDSFDLIDTSSSANANKHMVIYKVDSKDFSTLLSGVEFSLYKYDSSVEGKWAKVKDYTTHNGKIEFRFKDGDDEGDLEYDVVYKLKETKALQGYALPKDSYYFTVPSKKDKNTIWNDLDWNIKNEEMHNDSQNLNSISQNGDIIYITNEYTSIGVEKKWLDSNGVPLTPGADSIKVKLQRQTKEPTGCKVTIGFYHYNQHNQYNKVNDLPEQTVWIKRGTKLNIEWNANWNANELQGGTNENFSISLAGCKWSLAKIGSDGKGHPYITTPAITENTDIMIGCTFYGNWDNDEKVSLSYIPTDYTESVDPDFSEVVELNESDNGWQYVWENLDSGYYYFVTEISTIPGYSVSYSNNGIKNGQIIINNVREKKQQDYTLPETGGIGTNRFTAVGLSLMAASLMCEYVMRRKRRERRGK